MKNMDSIINQFNLRDWEGTVTKVVLFLAEDYRKEVNGSLLAIWKMRLAKYSADIVLEAFKNMLESRDEKNKRFMPSSEEFAEFCKSIKGIRNKQLQIGYQETESDKLTREEATKLYKTLKAKIEINRSTDPVRQKEAFSFPVYDFCNQNGKIVELRAFGHIETMEFTDQCESQHAVRPLKVIHCYDEFRQQVNKGDKQQRLVWQSQRCNNNNHATELTIGYI